jgi:hypothetical protein
MSTLKVTHLQNENGTGPAMSIAVGGGVTFAGISTFYGAIDLQTPTDLRVAAGATISGSTNEVIVRTADASSTALRLRSDGGGTNGGHLEGEGPKITFDAKRGNDGANSSASYIQQVAIGDLGSSWPVDLAFGVRRFGSSFEALRIASTGNVGIGTDNPNRTLSVFDTAPIIALQNSTTGTGTEDGFQLQSGGSDAYIVNYETGSTIFYTAGAERLRITSAGDLNIGSLFNTSSSSGFGIGHTITNVANNRTGCIKLQADGNNNAYYNVLEVYNGSSLKCNIKADGNIVLASGSGIDFSATAGSGISAGGGILDDYEEGSFTPGITINGSSTTASHAFGQYVKIGRLVTCFGRLTLTSNGSGTGASVFTGLPFTVADLVSTTALEGGGFFAYQVNVSGVYGAMTILPSQNSTDAAIYYAQSANGNMTGATENNIANDFDSRFVFSYHAA